MRLVWWAAMLVLAASVASADTVTVQRSVFGATGGTATGGPFSLQFTIGQTSVDRLQSTGTELISGFWWKVAGVPVDALIDEGPPDRFALATGAPNPFLTKTLIGYAIPRDGGEAVFIGVFNVQGHLVRTLVDAAKNAGLYTVPWDGTDNTGKPVASGVYFVRFDARNFHEHRRIVMLK